MSRSANRAQGQPPIPAEAPGDVSEQDPDLCSDAADAAHPAPLLWTTGVCAVTALLGHLALGFNFTYGWWPWQPIAGGSLSVVSVVSFGGFFLASRRARVAIAASFLLTFLVVLTYVLTIEEIAEVTERQTGLVSDFRIVVQTIVGFYFGTEAVVAAAKVLGVARSGGTASAVRRADRDLV